MKKKSRFPHILTDVDADFTLEDIAGDDELDEDYCDCEDEDEENNVPISALDTLRQFNVLRDYTERRLYLSGVITSTAASIGRSSNASEIANDIVRFNWEDDDIEVAWTETHPGKPLPKRTPIKIFINTSGGSLEDTMRLVEKITKSKTPVWTIADGLCASGGFYIFIAGEHRICSEYTTFLLHEGFLASDYHDSMDSMVRMAEHFAKFQKKKIRPFVRSRIKSEAGLIAYKKRLHSEWYFDADKAIKYGIADEIIGDLSSLR